MQYLKVSLSSIVFCPAFSFSLLLSISGPVIVAVAKLSVCYFRERLQKSYKVSLSVCIFLLLRDWCMGLLGMQLILLQRRALPVSVDYQAFSQLLPSFLGHGPYEKQVPFHIFLMLTQILAIGSLPCFQTNPSYGSEICKLLQWLVIKLLPPDNSPIRTLNSRVWSVQSDLD